MNFSENFFQYFGSDIYKEGVKLIRFTYKKLPIILQFNIFILKSQSKCTICDLQCIIAKNW